MKSQKLKKIIDQHDEDREYSEKTTVKLKRLPRKVWFGIHLYRNPLWLACDYFHNKKDPFRISWEYWEKKIQKICPIQYWCRETMRRELHFWFVTWVHQKWYEFKCWINPWNILRIKTLPNTWTDESHLLHHAMFAVLERYFNEKPDSIVDFTSTPHDRRFWKEINEVWNWWQKRQEREKLEEVALDIASKRPKHYKYRAKYGSYDSLVRRHEKELNKMLLKIIKWKDHLWV